MAIDPLIRSTRPAPLQPSPVPAAVPSEPSPVTVTVERGWTAPQRPIVPFPAISSADVRRFGEVVRERGTNAFRKAIELHFDGLDLLLTSLGKRQVTAAEAKESALSALDAIKTRLEPLIGRDQIGDRARIDEVVKAVNVGIDAVNARLPSLAALDYRILKLGDLPLPGVAREGTITSQLQAAVAYLERDLATAKQLWNGRVEALSAYVVQQFRSQR